MTFDTLEGVVFWTEISNFRKVQLLLKGKGFVNSNTWPTKLKEELGERFDDTLVYEENNVGLYRCSFHRDHQDGPCFEFKYWDSKLNPDQKNRDPMKPVVLEIYGLLKPVRVTNYAVDEILID
jgi:hypothetical protein